MANNNIEAFLEGILAAINSGDANLPVPSWNIEKYLAAIYQAIKEKDPADPDVVQEFVEDWLDNHPEATTTVEDGAVTSAKLADSAYHNTAAVFDTTKAYSVGDYVIYSGDLYRFNADKTAGAWDSTKVVAVALADDVKTAVYGFSKIPKSNITDYEKILTNGIYKITANDVGKNVSQMQTASASGANVYKIPLEGIDSITYPVFKSSASWGSIMVDQDGVVIYAYTEVTASTGTYKTIDVPDKAAYFAFAVSSGLNGVDGWIVTLSHKASVEKNRGSINDLVVKVGGITIPKNEIELYTYLKYYLYKITSDVVEYGKTSISSLTPMGAGTSALYKIPLNGANRITYPVFPSTSGYGSFICDENDVILWSYCENELSVGTYKTIDVPYRSSYFVFAASSSLVAMNGWEILLEKKQTERSEVFEKNNNNLCLAAIKTDITTNKIPFHRGFLFHKLMNNDNTLWYGEDFEHIKYIGTPAFSPNNKQIAISPKDGRIIAAEVDTRKGLWIYDGSTTTFIESFATKPMAWLYNSGVEFINDGDDEYCIFAEYLSSNSTVVPLYVWRGKYPYTSSNDWEIVLTQQGGDSDITHFHMVRRDPWTNILYCASGDTDALSKWWYSTDEGSTWTLLVNGTEEGWSGQVCRTINIVFTKDYAYWATDHGQNTHALYRIARDSQTGVFDLSTKTKITDLPALFATNSICYVESPHGLFFYDRIDTAPTTNYGNPIPFKFYNLDTNELEDVLSLKLTSNTWGGCRGKCYINYTNMRQPYPAMGFAYSTPCIFDVVCDDPNNIGSIVFQIGSKTIRSILKG